MICSNCLEEYKFTDIHYEDTQNNYVLYFSCLCPEPLPVKEEELEDMDLALSEETLDYIQEKKVREVKHQMKKRESEKT